MAVKDKNKMADIVEWDVENWSKAIEFWDAGLKNKDLTGKKVLDLGGRNGGVSLYWALRGAEVVCSDIDDSGFPRAKKLHKKYGVSEKVSYQIVDATDIPYQNEFDIISFKSVLGGVGSNGQYSQQKKMMDGIYASLKAEGACYFAENLKASKLHQFARKRFVTWGDRWRYIRLEELPDLAGQFSERQYQAIGFFGVFGRNQKASEFLGKVDSLFDRYIQDKDKYIVSGILKK